MYYAVVLGSSARENSNASVTITSYSISIINTTNYIILIYFALLLSIGSQQHLKSKFGKGFKIQLSFDISFQDKIDQYISSLIPSAVLVGDYWGKKMIIIVIMIMIMIVYYLILSTVRFRF